MLIIRSKKIWLFSIACCLLCLFSACGTRSLNASSSQTGSAPATSPTPIASATPLVVTTNCPAPGTGRSAVMPSLQLGKNQNIVYLTGAGGASAAGGELMALDRYDIQTGKTTNILNSTAKTAQISQDGQWVLFTAMIGDVSEIQLVRMDGKYLQTLYCAPAGQQVDPTNTTGMQWSPDQQQIIFNQGASSTSPAPLYLLNLASGQVQEELTVDDPKGPLFLPRTWIDNTRVYVSDFFPQAASLFILDTSKGANQHSSNMQVVVGVNDNLWNFDSSYDASTLFTTFYNPAVGLAGPGTYCKIFSDSIDGSNDKLVLDSNKLVVSNLRVIGHGSTSVMLEVDQQSGNAAQYNGLWKINSDGSGLTRLADHAGTDFESAFSPFTQYSWSNFSRDISLYTDGNFFGSLNGGALTQYAPDMNTSVVGWTTM